VDSPPAPTKRSNIEAASDSMPFLRAHEAEPLLVSLGLDLE
jgi:hypothetical protein